jgi:lipopolysaccharide export system protein LptC
MIGSLRNGWDRFVLYLPLIMVSSLAFGTYWLVHTTPSVGQAPTQALLTHDPDYFMRDFSIRTFDGDGRVRVEVLGGQAKHYPDTQWLEIEDIRIKAYDVRGRLTTASATRGLTNDDTSEVQFLGNVRVIRDSDGAGERADDTRMEYRGEFLHAFMDSERLSSHKPVELLRGKDRFTAEAMEYDNVDQVLTLRGRVRGTLWPTAN